MSVIMETANTATLHATRSKRVLSEFSCTSNVQDIDNLPTEAQGELLFDGWENDGDCNEEESLSDDSLCLRLSEDDESDSDDTRAPGLICNQHTNSKSDTTVNDRIDDDGNEVVCTSEEIPPGSEPSAEVMVEKEKKKDGNNMSASVKDESPEEDREEEELRDSSGVGLEEEPVKSDQLEEIGEGCIGASNNGALQPFSNIDASSRLDEKEEKSSPDPLPLRNEEQTQAGSKEQIVGVESTSKESQNGCSDKEAGMATIGTEKRERGSKQSILLSEDDMLGSLLVQCNRKENESARQKRKTAKDAEDIIRNKFLNSDSNLDSNDGSEMVVTVNDQTNVEERATSITTSATTAATTTITSTAIATGSTSIASPPHALKRKFIDIDLVDDDGNAKTKIMKTSFESEKDFGNAESSRNNKEAYKELAFVRKFFQRDAKQKLVKLKQEELEELLIQKIVEAIAMRGEIGRLREQARISEKNQEATRIKCQQLAKQIKHFETVLSHIDLNRRTNDNPVQPIKIRRSVGLQVNLMTDHGVQSLPQLQQQNTAQESSSVLNSTNPNFYESSGNTTNPRREIIVRVPQLPEASTPIATKVPTTATQVPSHPQISTETPAPLVVVKPLETSDALALPAECSIPQPTLPKPTQQSVIINGKLPIQANHQPVQTLNTRKSSTDDIIVLTDEGTEKTKSAVGPSIQKTTTFVPTQGTATSEAQTLPFQRVMQTLPGKMSLATQPTSISVAKSSSPSTPTTLEHPAPLPETSIYAMNPTWKLPPPPPVLKISKSASGIVLYWNIILEDKHADIASFQLYAYQEDAGVPPSTSLWKKVGDIQALPLPMACTLGQYSGGKNYHFAIRGVDTHSRLGQYSQPASISL